MTDFTPKDQPIKNKEDFDTFTSSRGDKAVWYQGQWHWDVFPGGRYTEIMYKKKLIEQYENASEEQVPPQRGETIVNARGAKQSYTGTRFDLIPPAAIRQVAQVLHTGAEKYGVDNWRGIETESHVNHAIDHLYAFLWDNDSEDLRHAATRLLMALEIDTVGVDE